jgi:hypothetical protein
MSTFELFEYGLVVVIIGLQGWFFLRTRTAILTYQAAIPDVSAFRLRTSRLVEDDLKTVSVGTLLDQLPQYEARARAGGAASRQLVRAHLFQRYQQQGLQGLPVETVRARVDLIMQETSDDEIEQIISDNNLLTDSKLVEISLLGVDPDADTPTMTTIQRAINTYLIRNKGAVSDFNLLRDIIQRNLDVLEEEITLTTPIPVYLGLVGTMLGIIIGLFALPDISSESFLNGNGIDSLLGGVKIAMIASAVGLMLTVITNGWLFKGAKTKVERRKNDFYTFLQTELLPILSQSVNAGVVSLNRSLDVFGAKFGTDIDKLNTLMKRNYESVMAQQSALKALKDMDVTTIAQFNVQVLGELRQSLSALERLAAAFKHTDEFAANARALVERTQDVVGLADRIGQVVDNAQSLQLYLNGHFQELENRGDLIKNTVTSFDQLVSREIRGLEEHIQERMAAVKDIKIDEDAWMQRAMRENQTALSNLRYLQPLSDTTVANASQQRATADTLRQLSTQTDRTNALLTQLLAEQRNRSFRRQVARLFGQKID